MQEKIRFGSPTSFATLRRDGPGVRLLEGPEREAMDRAMGVSSSSVRLPERLEGGGLAVHTVRPSDLRTRVHAAGAAAALGAARAVEASDSDPELAKMTARMLGPLGSDPTARPRGVIVFTTLRPSQVRARPAR
jgi:hypothetical protein